MPRLPREVGGLLVIGKNGKKYSREWRMIDLDRIAMVLQILQAARQVDVFIHHVVEDKVGARHTGSARSDQNDQKEK